MNPFPLDDRACETGSTTESRFRQDGRRGRICQMRQSSQRRNGTILIHVLVCLTVVTAILFGVVEVSIRNRQQIRTEIQLEQTYWLLDAGIGTANTKFQQAPDFAEYSFTTEETLKDYKGSVDIQVIERDDQRVSIRVTARLLGQHKLSPVTQRSRVIVLDNLQTNQTDSIMTLTGEVAIHERND